MNFKMIVTVMIQMMITYNIFFSSKQTSVELSQ